MKGILDLANIKLDGAAILDGGISQYQEEGMKIASERLNELGTNLANTQSRVQEELNKINNLKVRSSGAKTVQDQLTPEELATRLEQRVEKIRKDKGPETAAKAEKEILQQLKDVGKGLKRLDNILSKAAAAK